jgi:ABC-type nitrate/sulfonate/bicarbonate transport system substrate-binding protein
MKKLKTLLAAALAAISAITIAPRDARTQETKVAVIVFPGLQNTAIFAAQAKGFFAKRGLAVDLKFTVNSDELRGGLADGKYQIAHSAIDNAFALKDKANADIAVVLGGDNSFNHLLVQPDIKSLADVKGKTVVVDAVNTAYAFQLYEMLKQKGVNKGDYEIKPAGGTALRLDAMLKDKNNVAGMMNPPFSTRAVKEGLKDMGTAAAALGAYQGSSAFVLRPWAQANADTMVKYIQGYIEGWRWAFDPKNKAEVVKLLMERLKLTEEIATQAFDDTKADSSKDGAIDMKGVENVLKLRAQWEGGAQASPDKYLDLTYYKKAAAGM